MAFKFFSRSTAPVVPLLLAGMPAAAQVAMPPIARYAVPDFDQRRQGLANSGNNHCVPTSHSNLLAYIASHGFPPVFPNVAHPSWASEYQDITDNILQLGILMGTTGTGGTNGEGCMNGMASWLGGWNVLFSITYQWGPDVTPTQIYFNHLAGGLETFCYGRWEFISANSRYERTGGGHCVTLRGIENYYFPIQPTSPRVTLKYRDPAGDEGAVADRLTKQSPFATSSINLRPFSSTFKSYGSATMWEMITNTGDQYRRLLDGLTTIYPLFTLAPESNTLKLRTPIAIPGGMSEMTINLGNIADAAFGLHPTEVFAISDSAITASRLVRANAPAGTLTESMNLPGPGGKLAPGRRGEVYMVNNRTLRCLRPNNGTFIDEATPIGFGSPIDDICYDDVRDGPTILMGDGSVRVYNRGLTGTPTVRTMAIVPSFSGATHRILNGVGAEEYWVGPLTGNIIRKYVVAPDGSGRLIVGETFSLPVGGVTIPISDFAINPNGGTMLIVRNGVLSEWERGVAGGPWVMRSGSPFNGLAISGPFRFSRTRSNYDPSIHNFPEWAVDVADPQPLVPETPDCIADVAGLGGSPDPDGQLTADDVIAFLGAFFAGSLNADVAGLGGSTGGDGVLTADDVVIFLAAFFAGCP